MTFGAKKKWSFKTGDQKQNVGQILSALFYEQYVTNKQIFVFFFFYLQTYRIRTLSILLSVHVFKLLSQKTPNYLSIILLYTIKQKIGYIKKFLFLIIIVILRNFYFK